MVSEPTPDEPSFDILCLFHIFSQFHMNETWTEESHSKENPFFEFLSFSFLCQTMHFRTAERCGMQLIVKLGDFIKDLFTNGTLSFPHSKPNQIARSRMMRFHAAGNERCKFPTYFEPLSYWVSRLGSFGIVEVIPNFVFDSKEFLTHTIMITLKDLLIDSSLHGKRHFSFRQNVRFRRSEDEIRLRSVCFIIGGAPKRRRI